MRESEPARLPSRGALAAVVMAGLLGLSLMIQSAWWTSATYDEVAYLRVAARWWLTGGQAEITRMGSPLTFWKLQQIPALTVLPMFGQASLLVDTDIHQEALLPLVRCGALWIWVVALGFTSWWSFRLYGDRAMAASAAMFALSPNLLAHGALVTMELPVTAFFLASVFFFWEYLNERRPRSFVISVLLGGLAFSCKFTAILLPALLGMVWWIDGLFRPGARPFRLLMRAGLLVGLYMGMMLLSDFLITGLATLPPSHWSGQGHPSIDRLFPADSAMHSWLIRLAETPIPQDWVGFATQLRHQRSGGPSYLLGERRMTGWWYYYFVTLAVKVPPAVPCVLAVRLALSRAVRRDWILPAICAAFLAITAVGSTRNYGFRYLLPLSPLAIVWASGLARRGAAGQGLLLACVLGQGWAVISSHPNEITYFNVLAGGREGGRRILSDSNLDWGQGLKSLARMQRESTELRDLTLYYFGDVDPRHYGVAGTSHLVDASDDHPGLPLRFTASTRFVAVSASLQFGPWGPEGYFDALKGIHPYAMTDGATIAIYRAGDVPFEGPSQ